MESGLKIKDKSERMDPSFFTYYDDSQFENPDLKKAIEKSDPLNELMAQKNRFNKSLVEGVHSKN